MNTYFKFLSRNKFYTFVTVFGFAISLMFVLLIGVYTYQELAVDNFQEKGSRIYLLANEHDGTTSHQIPEAIRERYPEIEEVTAISPFRRMSMSVGEEQHQSDILMTDTSFFKIFSIPIVEGNTNLIGKNDAIISETFARKIFPDTDPIGKIITYNEHISVVVTGVMKDIKNSTIPYADIIFNIDLAGYFNGSMSIPNFANAGSSLVFILSKEGSNLSEKAPDMADYFREIFWVYKIGSRKEVKFIPLKEFYFSELDTNGMAEQGNKSFVLILMSVGIIILLFAVINYISLSIAQTGFRAKEMATRALLGSKRGDLFMRLISESILLTGISFFISIIFTFLFKPFAERILETSLHMDIFFSPLIIAGIALFIILLGIISGIFPAILISKTKPIHIVKGTFQLKNKMVFSKVFIVFQNMITIALLVASLVMVSQVNHLIHAPLGYETKNIISIPTWNGAFKSKQDVLTFGNELNSLACVENIGYGSHVPYAQHNYITHQNNNKNISIKTLELDRNAIGILGLKFIKENNLANKDAFYFNKRAYDILEIDENDTSVPEWYNWQVAGMLEDIQLNNILESKYPVSLKILDTDVTYPVFILVEIRGNHKAALNEIITLYQNFTEIPFLGQFIEDIVAESFDIQRQTSLIVSIFCAIAVLISLLGLIAMSTFLIQQRLKELAIRRAFGSSVTEILSKLIFSFLIYILLAFVLISPIIAVMMNKWLANYSYRIVLSPVYFIIAGLFCLIIATLAVLYQSYKAAIANPIDSLKND